MVRSPVRTPYMVVYGRPGLQRVLQRLQPLTLLVDVEPFVARWGTDARTLGEGVAQTLAELSSVDSFSALWFVSNSDREPPEVLRTGCRYVGSANKPWRIKVYQGLPRPGLVLGDQILTDGLLAYRLGYSFIHYRQSGEHTPLLPMLQEILGKLVRPFIFKEMEL